MVQSLLKPVLWIGLGVGLLLLFLSRSQIAGNLENQVFDAFMRWTAEPKRWPEEIVLLLVDDEALQSLGDTLGRWPWPRDAHAALVAFLKRSGARAVLYDVLFSEPSFDALQDDRFATYLRATDQTWLAAKRQENGSLLGPIPVLKSAVQSRVGLVNVQKDPDGILRRYPLGEEHLKSLACAFMAPVKTDGFRDGSMLLRWYGPLGDLHPLSAGIVGKGLKMMDSIARRGSPKGFDAEDWKQVADLLNGEPLPMPNLFANKIVFVGLSAAGTFDPLATPVGDHEFGVVTHATALANLMRNDFLKPAPSWLHAAFILAAAMLVALACACASQVRWQSLSTLLSLLVIVGVSWALFQAGWWLPPLMAFVAGVASFTAITTYHYFTEGKQKRWLKQLFSDFVSAEVLEELQHNPQGFNMRGDLRVGTVLFCDLEGFTTFTESSTPDQFIDAINAYLSEASRALLARGAYIDKFIGDAVMAVFGVPKAQPDHAAPACFAALALQEMMVDLNERLGRQYGLKLRLRIGVNTGEMIAGPIGFARKLNYTVLGDTVNLASRLEGANKSYHSGIMIGPQTRAMAGEAVETRILDFLRVKGKNKAVEVYELMARKGELSPEQIRLRNAYLEGVEHYRRRLWNEAEADFNKALSIAPNDGPSQTYVERCRFYREHPPGADWDGSFGLDQK